MILVAGAFCGVVVAGFGGRLMMFVLRLTSPDGIQGLLTDDGFRIGEFSFLSTLGLVTIGATTGVVGAGAYLLVRPWLLGPLWLRRLAVTLAGGAIGGTLLVSPDGNDLRLLEPRWLAVALCVVLGAAFAYAVGVVADRVAAPGSWTHRAPWRWALPAIALGSLTWGVVFFAVVAVVAAVVVALRPLSSAIRRSAVATFLVRAAFLVVAVAGVVGLVVDIVAIADLEPSPFSEGR